MLKLAKTFIGRNGQKMKKNKNKQKIMIGKKNEGLATKWMCRKKCRNSKKYRLSTNSKNGERVEMTQIAGMEKMGGGGSLSHKQSLSRGCRWGGQITGQFLLRHL